MRVTIAAERPDFLWLARRIVQVVLRGATLELATADDRADFHAWGAASFNETLLGGQKRTVTLRSPCVCDPPAATQIEF